MYCYLKSNKGILIVGIFLTLLFSCGENGDDNLEVITPTHLTITITIVGADANNPNGDGLGVIQCSASATNAVSYGFRFGTGSEIESSSGNVEYTYTEKGINNYTVYATAYSSTGHPVTISKEITVFVTSELQLIWSDEFDTNGSPDDAKWNYDIGRGNNGWGNSEAQYYTSREENVVVEDGVLKITAKKESFEGAQYTSTRMKTQGKFDFKYGKVEVKAKLPEGGGTWPAIWMLGKNIDIVGWPACGEIDIMEHRGNNFGIVSSALHTPSSFGGTINTGSRTVSNVSTEFHIYTVEWTQEKMMFSVDDAVFYTYNPTTKTSSTWPFIENQFIILNVAMGGGFGGAIDSNFIESTMEIDYVRVYQ